MCRRSRLRLRTASQHLVAPCPFEADTRMHARLDRGAVKLHRADWTHKRRSPKPWRRSMHAWPILTANCAASAPTAFPRSTSSSSLQTAATPRRWFSSCSIFSTSTAKISALWG
jgi:hypothetical protein